MAHNSKGATRAHRIGRVRASCVLFLLGASHGHTDVLGGDDERTHEPRCRGVNLFAAIVAHDSAAPKPAQQVSACRLLRSALLEMNILVTVGMSQWPFDRLIKAIIPLCHEHSVFVQTGASTIVPPCPYAPFIPYEELIQRISAADVVITHAGNTVRLTQRAGKVPIAVARTASEREMSNDHQVDYLHLEAACGRVVAIWDVQLLHDAVANHRAAESRLLTERELPERADAIHISNILDSHWARVANNPFKHHPLRRYAFAWNELSERTGRHLDLGCGTGDFLSILATTTALECHGADPHQGYLQEITRKHPDIPVHLVPINGPLPFPNQSFTSVSLMDALEHCPEEDELLREVARVLAPDGLLVITVPRRHVLSWLDPDNAKFRFPRIHRAIYTMRFGKDLYHERFVDLSNGLCGDMSVGKRVHTNYRRDWLVALLERLGFALVSESGANLFWRLFHVPALLGGQRLRERLNRAIWLDGQLFKRANLFLSVRKLS
jgi:SAM-dependent methyltransferase